MDLKSICIIFTLTLSLLIVQSRTVQILDRLGNSNLPWNPLEALDWQNVNLTEQISDDFIINDGTTESVEFRTYSGEGNNIQNPDYGKADSFAPRCLPPVYADGFNALTGQTRMNPREISNVLSRQLPANDPKFENSRDLTQFAWQWGQFIDHDITLISEDKSALDLNDDIDIYIPCGDPEFDSNSECDADIQDLMQVFRTHSHGTGTDNSNIRQQTNEITSFIDASMIYGSDENRAHELRTFQNGRMKMDEVGNLPLNENNLPNEPGDHERFFIGGDVRVNEQLGLLTMHTIWVRAHNIISEYVATSIEANGIADPTNAVIFDETVYQYTKLIINAIVQKIVYKDWLPTLFGHTAMQMFLGIYDGYNDSINPGICPIFASAAFRLGHTVLPDILPLRNQDCTNWEPVDLEVNCNACSGGGIDLKNAFFVPQVVKDTDGFYEALLNGFACTKANEVDTFITDGVRNFLFFSSEDENGQRLFGDLDLVAINLQRGREHGLPDYNSVRQQLGLGAHTSFNDMTSDSDLADQFWVMYKENIDDVDLFLGGLAEDHFPDGSFGETISAIVLGQFGRLRDGDRFFYQNYIKPGELLDFINCMTLKSIIELTTDIENIDAIDSIRHNIFQNSRAINIFEGGDTFDAQQIPINEGKSIHEPLPNINNEYNDHKEWNGIHLKNNGNNNNNNGNQPEMYVIELTNVQIWLMLCLVIVTVGCGCYALHKYQQNKNKKYHPVKYDTETDTDRI